MDLSPDEDLTREAYARFGLAYYMTECVYRGLVHMFAILPFGPTDATRPRIEERMKAAEQMTLGELVSNTRSLLPADLRASLDWALTTRNFFAHGFWFERIHLMTTENGKEQLISELTQATDRMRGLNQALDALTFAHMRRLGATEEHLAIAFQESAHAPVEPLPTRGIPRAEETVGITAAWVITEGDRSTLVLRDVDGEMWQLCDAGLGWHYSAEPSASWRPFDKLNVLLPASEEREAVDLQAPRFDRGANLRRAG